MRRNHLARVAFDAGPGGLGFPEGVEGGLPGRLNEIEPEQELHGALAGASA